ncbi:MAG: histidine phosphatase family protein [Solirubrobacterales bacterium]|nr:MAG: histidine phosphatase family protein [Solirubrobacterales bacterium]
MSDSHGPDDGLLLARHGETDDNLEPIRAQGFRDTPLNDTGRRQAAELAARAAELGIASLWSSDLARARETAEIVGGQLGLRPRLDPRLREADRGEWEGRLFLEIERDDPGHYAAWRRAGEGFRFPGGESLREQSDRVAEALSSIRSSGELPALVVCHGGSIRATLCRSHQRGLDAFHEFVVPNVAVVRV